jgi:phosphoglycolate phosphatase
MGMNVRIAVESITLDLDGTLLDTVPDLSAAANMMLREIGLPQREEAEVRQFVGSGIPMLVARCITRDVGPEPALLERAIQVFRGYYAVTNGRRATVYPGVIAGLTAFRRMGLKLACITNKAAAFTEPLIRMTGVADYLDLTVSGDTLPEKKPHPRPLLYACEYLGVAPADNLHIGDSHNDATAARAAGCRVFCVPYGYNEGTDVRKLDCDAIVLTLEEAATRITALNSRLPTLS